MDENIYDLNRLENNTEKDKIYWNCYTDVTNALEPGYVQDFLAGNWSSDINNRTSEVELIPSFRAVGIKNPYYKSGNELPIQVTGSDTFKNAVKKVLTDHAQPYINLKFVFDKPGGVLIDNNYSGGGVCRCLGCKSPHISVSSAEQGLVLHEFGHALGMHHEMKNPNIKITWIESVLVQMFGSADFVKSQITSKIDANSVNATAFDKNSVMIYPLPAKTNQEGINMSGARNYTDLDRQWLKQAYGDPKIPPPPPSTGTQPPTQPRPQPPTQPPRPPPRPLPTTKPKPPPTTKSTTTKPPTTKSTTTKPSSLTPTPTPSPSQTPTSSPTPPLDIVVSQSWLDSIIMFLISLFGN